MLHNFIRDEQQSDSTLEVQGSECLSVFDVELTNQQGNKVRNNNVDEVTIIQATEEWTRFCNTLVMNMFASYQATENFI